MHDQNLYFLPAHVIKLIYGCHNTKPKVFSKNLAPLDLHTCSLSKKRAPYHKKHQQLRPVLSQRFHLGWRMLNYVHNIMHCDL